MAPAFLRMLGLAALCLLSSCVAHPEFNALSAKVLTNCQGNEVVGIWVSQLDFLKGAKVTMQLRPDGTGRWRYGAKDQSSERDLNWSYAGGGIWRAQVIGKGSPFALKTTGRELLMFNVYRLVFVNAADEAAVDDFLSRRSSHSSYKRPQREQAAQQTSPPSASAPGKVTARP
ncbi:hypothetical protein [Prosthecobacter sp.]|uniref:hypothetical protein n=1 Tax=Prosthecobacter sp. TaxID=1965333 RepID=UPI0037844A53